MEMIKINNDNNIFINNIPSISDREFKYRTRMDSHELNSLQQEAFNDILDLFNKANKLQKTIYEMNLINSIESICYTKRLQEAVKLINELAEHYNNQYGKDEYKMLTQYAFSATTINDGFNAIIDKNTNDIVAHIISSKSKTRLYDETYDTFLVPPSLQLYIGPDTFKVGGEIYSIEDNDSSNALSGNDDAIWFRKVVTSPNVNYIDNEVVIGLPEDIITTRLINQISIKPFPVGYLDILDVRYKSKGSWQTIHGFNNHSCCNEYEDTDIFGNKFTYHCICNSPNIKFNFPDIMANQIKVKLRQRNYEYDAENNRRIWYLGLRDIDIVHNVYTRDHSQFEMVFDFKEKDRNIKVYDVLVFANNYDTVTSVTKEYFYYDENGNTHKIPSSCPFILNGHKLMVRFTIEGGQNTPNIYKCSVKYNLI